jgi:biopolymer transport protein ExbD
VGAGFYTKKRRAPSIIIVSLIDILAILLIFFIVTTTFKKDQPQLKIALPESKSAAAAEAKEQPFVLEVKDEQTMQLDGQPVGVRWREGFVERGSIYGVDDSE